MLPGVDTRVTIGQALRRLRCRQCRGKVYDATLKCLVSDSAGNPVWKMTKLTSSVEGGRHGLS